MIKSALTEYLGGVAATQLKGKVVESYLDDKLSYNELAVVIGRQNAESVKVSKRLLEGSDRIAEVAKYLKPVWGLPTDYAREKGLL